MKTKLIKLSDIHYVIVDGSEIKEGDFFIHPDKTIERASRDLDGRGVYKITHSTQPLEAKRFGFDKIELLYLSEVEEVINGYSVEKMADDYVKSQELKNRSLVKDGWNATGFVNGFEAHQELVKDRDKKVIELLKKITDWNSFRDHPIGKQAQRCLDILLPKTEWEIEFVNGKNKLINNYKLKT